MSKVGQDLISFQYFVNDHIRYIRARIFNSTGTQKENDVISDFTYRAVQAEKTGVYESRIGNLEIKCVVIDQRDLVNAFMIFAEKGTLDEVYNIFSENIYKMREIVNMVEAQTGHKFKTVVEPKLLRPTDEKIIIGNVTKLKRDTGWSRRPQQSRPLGTCWEYWREKERFKVMYSLSKIERKER